MSEPEAPAPAIDRRLLAQAALAVGIDLRQISSTDTPWHNSLPPARAELWAAALAELDPMTAEAMQRTHGGPLSMALQMALDGEAPMTPELVGELRVKRPELHKQRAEAAIADALAAMEADAQARRAARDANAAAAIAADAEARRRSAEAARQTLAAQHRARGGEW